MTYTTLLFDLDNTFLNWLYVDIALDRLGSRPDK